jgi:class 3 adenylate cyclase
MAALPSGTVTSLFTDIEGRTARWEHQPEATPVVLARHDALLRAAIIEHGDLGRRRFAIRASGRCVAYPWYLENSEGGPVRAG